MKIRNRFSKIELVCFVVFVIVGLLCLSWFFLYSYFIEPEISLKGSKEVTVMLNSDYKDAGAIAKLDNVDISDNIKVYNKVNFKKVGDYTITYSVTNSKGRKKKEVTRVVKVRDNEKPTLVLKKGSPYKVQYGSTYKEPGYTAKDNYDGNLVSQVKVSGIVNTKKIGKCKLYYTVVDSSNNKVSKVRIVNVVDEVSPVIKLNGKTKVIVSVGKKYLDQGFVASDNYDGDLTGKVKKTGYVNTSVAGVYTLTYSVSDSFGNYSSVTRIVQVGTQNDIDEDNNIMVSIDKQKLWYYRNGKLKLTSNVVTGMKGVHDTKKGSFRIKSKAQGVYLVGEDYRSWVNYWMLIDYGSQIGLHDATWRSSFGGNIYLNNGSHGCINLPYWVAQTIFNSAPVGILVLVY